MTFLVGGVIVAPMDDYKQAALSRLEELLSKQPEPSTWEIDEVFEDDPVIQKLVELEKQVRSISERI